MLAALSRLADTLPRSGTAVVLTSGGPVAWAAASLLADTERRKLYGAGLHERVNKHYRAEVIANAYSELYGRHIMREEA